MILNADVNQNGFINYTIKPLYIDDYLTKPADGELGNYILDYIAERSKELDTYVHVDIDNQFATIIIDTNFVPRHEINFSVTTLNFKDIELNGESFLFQIL